MGENINNAPVLQGNKNNGYVLRANIKIPDVFHTDAYRLAVQNGFEGTLEEWLDSLKGDPGYTPVRGTDYWTEEDKQEIVNEFGAISVDSVGEGLIFEAIEGTLQSVTHTYEQMAEAGLTGYLVNDGTVTTYANNYVSDFIEVTKCSTVQYSVNAIGSISKVLCYYDADKSLLGSVNSSGAGGSFVAQIGEITLPENAVYIRISMAKVATTTEINMPSKQYFIYSIGEPSSKLSTLKIDQSYIKELVGDVNASETQLEELYAVKSITGEVINVTDAIVGNIRGVTVNDGASVESVNVMGKNLFYRNYEKTETTVGVTFYWDAENQELVLNGTKNGTGDLKVVNPIALDWIPGEKYTVSVRHVSGTATLGEGAGTTTFSWGIFASNASKFIRGSLGLHEFPELYIFTGTAFEYTSYVFYLQCWANGTVFDNYRVKVQIEKGDKVTDWEPYRKETAPIDEATALTLRAGYNNVFTSPLANITLDYTVTPQVYIDSVMSGKGSWEGKKWFAFGTSITDTSYTNAETGTPTGKYVPYLTEMSGLSVTNCGIAGGTWGKGGKHGGSANILNRILTTDLSGADLITIEGCVNDFACAVALGELGDTGGTDAVANTETITICGALYRAVKHCLETAPNAIVILLTESTGKEYTMKSTGQTADYCVDRKNSLGLFQKDYNDIIVDMGRFMGVRVIDAGSKSQINCFNPEYIVDQIHHTELGGKQYATVIWDELKNISPKVTE
jgi:hypothetical protein